MIDRTDNRIATTQRVTSAIANASARTGVSFDYLIDQARIESGMRPNARASTSSAAGLYQFTRQTWLGTVKQHGDAHGLGWAADAITRNADGRYSVASDALRSSILDLRNNPEAAAAMAAEFAADNSDYLQSRIGGSPEPVDLYLAHFLGAQGAARFLSAHDVDPNQSAAILFPAAASSNRPIFYRDDGSTRSLSEIRGNFAVKLGKSLDQPPVLTVHKQGSIANRLNETPMKLAQMDPMPKRLDLDFARQAYRRLSGSSV
jgi:hypothetical protein